MAAEASIAIGVSASAITFASFAARCIKAIKAIHEACGELPSGIRRSQQLTDDFSRLLKRLESRIEQPESAQIFHNTVSDFRHVIDDGTKAVKELLRILESIEPSDQEATRPKWTSKVKTGLRLARKETKIKAILQTLEQARDHINLLISERTFDCSTIIRHNVEQQQNTLTVYGTQSQSRDQDVLDSLVDIHTKHADVQRTVLRCEIGISDIRNRIDRESALTRQALIQGGRDLDPNFIYIAIPRNLFNPLPLWYRQANNLARSLATITRDKRQQWAIFGSLSSNGKHLEPAHIDNQSSLTLNIASLRSTVQEAQCDYSDVDIDVYNENMFVLDELSKKCTSQLKDQPILRLRRPRTVIFRRTVCCCETRVNSFRRTFNTSFLEWLWWNYSINELKPAHDHRDLMAAFSSLSEDYVPRFHPRISCDCESAEKGDSSWDIYVQSEFDWNRLWWFCMAMCAVGFWTLTTLLDSTLQKLDKQVLDLSKAHGCVRASKLTDLMAANAQNKASYNMILSISIGHLIIAILLSHRRLEWLSWTLLQGLATALLFLALTAIEGFLSHETLTAAFFWILASVTHQVANMLNSYSPILHDILRRPRSWISTVGFGAFLSMVFRNVIKIFNVADMIFRRSSVQCLVQAHGIVTAQSLTLYTRTVTIIMIDVTCRYFLGDKAKLNPIAFSVMVLLVGTLFATFRW